MAKREIPSDIRKWSFQDLVAWVKRQSRPNAEARENLRAEIRAEVHKIVSNHTRTGAMEQVFIYFTGRLKTKFAPVDMLTQLALAQAVNAAFEVYSRNTIETEAKLCQWLYGRLGIHE